MLGGEVAFELVTPGTICKAIALSLPVRVEFTCYTILHVNMWSVRLSYKELLDSSAASIQFL